VDVFPAGTAAAMSRTPMRTNGGQSTASGSDASANPTVGAKPSAGSHRFCTECGQPILEFHMFCGSCGIKISRAPAAEAPAATEVSFGVPPGLM